MTVERANDQLWDLRNLLWYATRLRQARTLTSSASAVLLASVAVSILQAVWSETPLVAQDARDVRGRIALAPIDQFIDTFIWLQNDPAKQNDVLALPETWRRQFAEKLGLDLDTTSTWGLVYFGDGTLAVRTIFDDATPLLLLLTDEPSVKRVDANTVSITISKEQLITLRAEGGWIVINLQGDDAPEVPSDDLLEMPGDVLVSIRLARIELPPPWSVATELLSAVSTAAIQRGTAALQQYVRRPAFQDKGSWQQILSRHLEHSLAVLPKDSGAVDEFSLELRLDHEQRQVQADLGVQFVPDSESARRMQQLSEARHTLKGIELPEADFFYRLAIVASQDVRDPIRLLNHQNQQLYRWVFATHKELRSESEKDRYRTMLDLLRLSNADDRIEVGIAWLANGSPDGVTILAIHCRAEDLMRDNLRRIHASAKEGAAAEIIPDERYLGWRVVGLEQALTPWSDSKQRRLDWFVAFRDADCIMVRGLNAKEELYKVLERTTRGEDEAINASAVTASVRPRVVDYWRKSWNARNNLKLEKPKPLAAATEQHMLTDARILFRPTERGYQVTLNLDPEQLRKGLAPLFELPKNQVDQLRKWGTDFALEVMRVAVESHFRKERGHGLPAE